MPFVLIETCKTPEAAVRGRIEVLLVCCSLIVAVILGEAIVRLGAYTGLINYPSPKFEAIIHRYAANPALVYELKPSAEVIVDGVLIRTNSWGMRDYEYPLSKPAGVKRIAVIGDSVTFGQILPFHQQTFPKQLEAQLNYDGRQDFEVLNFSVVGYNSAQEEIVLREKVLQFKPDLVMIGFCLNDDTFTDGLAELATQTAPWSLGSRLNSKLVSYILHRTERMFFRSRSNSEQIRHLFQSLSELGKERGFQAMVLVFPYFFEDINSYTKLPMHTLVGRLAQDYGLPVLDYLDLWKNLDLDTRRRIYAPNEKVHFSSYGMRQVTDPLAAALQNEVFKLDHGVQAQRVKMFELERCITILETRDDKRETTLVCPKGSLAVAHSGGKEAQLTCCPLQQASVLAAENGPGDIARENTCANGEAISGLDAAKPIVFCRRLNEEFDGSLRQTRSFLLDSITAWRPELQAIAAAYPSGACACPQDAALVGLPNSSPTDCDDWCVRLGN